MTPRELRELADLVESGNAEAQSTYVIDEETERPNYLFDGDGPRHIYIRNVERKVEIVVRLYSKYETIEERHRKQAEMSSKLEAKRWYTTSDGRWQKR